MKNWFYNLIYISVFIQFSFISCKPISKQELILGKWKVDSILWYHGGKETIHIPKYDERDIVGTVYNPRIQEFNKYGDLIAFRLNDFQNRTTSTYKFWDNESKIKIISGSPGMNDYNESTWDLKKLTRSELEYSVIYGDPAFKVSITFFMSKLKERNIETYFIQGTWQLKYFISYVTSGEINFDSTLNQSFNFEKDTLRQLVFNANKIDKYNMSYKIKIDSLIVTNWTNFYIFKLDKKNLVLTHNEGINIGDRSGFTSYYVWVLEKQLK